MENIIAGNEKYLDRLNIMNLNTQNEEMILVKYNSFKDVIVKFINSTELVKTTYGNFMAGRVKSHFANSVFGVGTVELETTVDENGKPLNAYKCWNSMLARCYSANYQAKSHSYIGCHVSKSWLTFGNFKKFYDANYYKIEGQKTALDKDILFKHNKIYSEDTCVFAPQNINNIFINYSSHRNLLPKGVYFDKTYNKYQSQCNNSSGKLQYLGMFTEIKSAFNAYKVFKENFIKEMATMYKGQIPENLYIAMQNYIVEITD